MPGSFLQNAGRAGDFSATLQDVLLFNSSWIEFGYDDPFRVILFAG